MRQTIAFLRLGGIFSIVLFIISRMMDYLAMAKIMMYVSICCFAVVILLQLYRFYIQYYLNKD